MKQRLKDSPSIVRQIMQHGAFMLGSYLYDTNAKDIDILVPYKEWSNVSMLISAAFPRLQVTLNTLGGYKLTLENSTVLDVWPGNLEDILIDPNFKGAYHSRSDTFIVLSNK